MKYHSKALPARENARKSLILRLTKDPEERVTLMLASAALIHNVRHWAFKDDRDVIVVTAGFLCTNTGMRGENLLRYVRDELGAIEVVLVGNQFVGATAWRLLPPAYALFARHAALIDTYVARLAKDKARQLAHADCGEETVVPSRPPDAVTYLPVNRRSVETYLGQLPPPHACSPAQLRARAALPYILASLDKKDRWCHRYWVKPGGGRLYALGMPLSIQNLPSELRRVILAGTDVVRFDIQNTFPTILDHLATLLGAHESALHDYVKYRAQYLQALSSALDIPTSTVKQVILAIVCGAPLLGDAIAELLGTPPAQDKATRLDDLRRRCPALVDLATSIVRAVRVVRTDAGIPLSAQGSTDFSIYLQNYEREWVELFAQNLRARGFEINAYLHDEVFLSASVFTSADEATVREVAAQTSSTHLPFVITRRMDSMPPAQVPAVPAHHALPGIECAQDARSWTPSPAQLDQLLELMSERDRRERSYENGMLDGLDSEEDFDAELARIRAQISDRLPRPRKSAPRAIPTHPDTDEETDLSLDEYMSSRAHPAHNPHAQSPVLPSPHLNPSGPTRTLKFNIGISDVCPAEVVPQLQALAARQFPAAGRSRASLLVHARRPLRDAAGLVATHALRRELRRAHPPPFRAPPDAFTGLKPARLTAPPSSSTESP